MDVFDLQAVLRLDKSQYDSGLSEASSSAGSFGSGVSNVLGTVAKVGTAMVGAATAAAVGFATTAVQTNMTFDSSMSQVAATMGYSIADLNDKGSEASQTLDQLRTFAMDMGAKTAFSASEAADALNYMALAGYDAETSMDMLPTVLNLAAAGSIDLASASDMVTDAQSALGLSIDETTVMVDQMAKASSKSNTSVSQLGEAFLTVGATARSLKGGTSELATILGVLADNGTKGAEGGTSLRNIMMSLTSPTKSASKAINALGLEIYDSEGNMNSMIEIIKDMQSALDGLSAEERDQIINDIFNKADIADVNALLGTSVERWDELGAAIDDSAGAAQAMAETQLDNLAGDITLFQSAMESAQIVLGSQLDPSLREFVQFGTEGVGKITEAFSEGGLSGAMNAFGEVLSDGLAMVLEMVPQFVEAGIQLLGALGQGLIENLPTLIDAAFEIITTLGSYLMEAAPNLLEAAMQVLTILVQSFMEAAPQMMEAGMQFIQSISEGLVTGIPKFLAQALPMITKFSGSIRENAGLLVDAAIQLIVSLVQGLVNGLPQLIAYVPTIVSNIAGIINDNGPKILAAGIQVIVTLISGLIQSLPDLLANIGNICKAIIDVWMAINWINLGVKLITFIGDGIASLFSSIPSKMLEIGNNAVSKVISIDWAGLGSNVINYISNGISGLFSSIPNVLMEIGQAGLNAFLNLDWLGIGANIINGIISGINSAGGALINTLISWASSALQSAKNFLGINSPSRLFRDQVGVGISEGIAVGIEKADPTPTLLDTIEEMVDASEREMEGFGVSIPATYSATVQVSKPTEQNTSNSEELADLISTCKKYFPLFAQTKIVLDSGTMVGEMLPAIDEQMGELLMLNGGRL